MYPLPAVDVVDVDLSDHRLLRWTSQLHRPPSLYATAVRRRWTLFDVDVFRADLLTSSLSDVGSYVDVDGHALAMLYESTVIQLFDRQIPALSVTWWKCSHSSIRRDFSWSKSRVWLRYTRSCSFQQIWQSTGLRSGLLAGHRAGVMKYGVS